MEPGGLELWVRWPGAAGERAAHGVTLLLSAPFQGAPEEPWTRGCSQNVLETLWWGRAFCPRNGPARCPLRCPGMPPVTGPGSRVRSGCIKTSACPWLLQRLHGGRSQSLGECLQQGTSPQWLGTSPRWMGTSLQWLRTSRRRMATSLHRLGSRTKGRNPVQGRSQHVGGRLRLRRSQRS